MSGMFSREAMQQAGGITLETHEIDELLKANKSEILLRKTPAEVMDAVGRYFERRQKELPELAAKYGVPLAEIQKGMPFQISHIEAMFPKDFAKLSTTVEPLRIPVSSNIQNATNNHSPLPPIPMQPSQSRFFSNLTSEQKIHGGLWMLSAAMSAVFTWNAARQIAYADEQGKQHINASAVGLTLVQGLFAAGSAYLGMQALRGR